MAHVSVIQHTQSEFLGHIEDHLEGRGIRFGYHRPFTGNGTLPDIATIGDGLILVGGGPWGAAAGPRQLPTLAAEVRLARACLMLDKPVIGIGLGSQILCLAAEGAVVASPLVFAVGEARRVSPDGLGGRLPARFPMAVYMRDRPMPPDYAEILAVGARGETAVFQVGPRAFGFIGHPGIRRAMIEDLIMEFDESPDGTGPGLDALAAAGRAIEDALVPVMTGIIAATGLMAA